MWTRYRDALLAGGSIGLLTIGGLAMLQTVRQGPGQGVGFVIACLILAIDVGLIGLLAFRWLEDMRHKRSGRRDFIARVHALRRVLRKAKVTSQHGLGPQMVEIENHWTETHGAMQKLKLSRDEDVAKIGLFDEGIALTIFHMNALTPEAIHGGPAIRRFHRLASAGEKLCRAAVSHFD